MGSYQSILIMITDSARERERSTEELPVCVAYKSVHMFVRLKHTVELEDTHKTQ